MARLSSVCTSWNWMANTAELWREACLKKGYPLSEEGVDDTYYHNSSVSEFKILYKRWFLWERSHPYLETGRLNYSFFFSDSPPGIYTKFENISSINNDNYQRRIPISQYGKEKGKVINCINVSFAEYYCYSSGIPFLSLFYFLYLINQIGISPLAVHSLLIVLEAAYSSRTTWGGYSINPIYPLLSVDRRF